MLERLLIAGFIGLLSLAGFEILNTFQRQKASNAKLMNKHITIPQILYFRSKNCPGCETQSRLMSQLDAKLKQVIQKIDVDENPQLAQVYGVLSLPTTLVMDADGQVRYINYGVVNPSKLTNQWMSMVT